MVLFLWAFSILLEDRRWSGGIASGARCRLFALSDPRLDSRIIPSMSSPSFMALQGRKQGRARPKCKIIDVSGKLQMLFLRQLQCNVTPQTSCRVEVLVPKRRIQPCSWYGVHGADKSLSEILEHTIPMHRQNLAPESSSNHFWL